MKLPSKAGRFGLLLLVASLVPRSLTRGEGPILVGGPPQSVSFPEGVPNSVPGQPYRWTINPVTYWTDLGTLGTRTKAQADALVALAFGAWHGVPTAAISFSKAGDLSQDVTAANALAVFNNLFSCPAVLPNSRDNFIAQPRTVIYDTDGSIFAAMGADPNLVLGEASPLCPFSDGVTNAFIYGFAMLNGKPASTDPELESTMIHEFGHMVGLDHSQINLDCLSVTGCSAAELAGVPIMFPVAVNPTITPTTDDQASISVLYPNAAFATTGRITGHILFSDGVTPAQGYNVIAREVSSPQTIAVSSTSGYLFTACVGNAAIAAPNNDCGPAISAFGSRAPTLIGSYDIPGLPPGNQWTVTVEALNNSSPFPFTGGSSVGPIGVLGFNYPMPGSCTTESWNNAESATDNCAGVTAFTATSGVPVTGKDIILNGTPPRFDGYED